MIEMLNAMNALSDDQSLLVIPPTRNLYLVAAMMGSTLIHVAVLTSPMLCQVFNVCPLDAHDWGLVLAFSFPVVFIDEVMKAIGRLLLARELAGKQKTD